MKCPQPLGLKAAARRRKRSEPHLWLRTGVKWRLVQAGRGCGPQIHPNEDQRLSGRVLPNSAHLLPGKHIAVFEGGRPLQAYRTPPALDKGRCRKFKSAPCHRVYAVGNLTAQCYALRLKRSELNRTT